MLVKLLMYTVLLLPNAQHNQLFSDVWRVCLNSVYSYIHMKIKEHSMHYICYNYVAFVVDGTKGFSIDQLKGKQLLLKFRPDALVVFRAKVLKMKCWRAEDALVVFTLALKMTIEHLVETSTKVVFHKLVYRKPPSSILVPTENHSLHTVKMNQLK